MDFSERLGEMILAAEGRRLAQVAVPGDASQGLRQMAGLLSSVVSSDQSPSDMLIDQVKKESDNYTRQHLLPNIRTGGRLQPKGVEAASSYVEAKKVVSRDWPRMFEYIRGLRAPTPLPVSLIRPEALKVPVDSLQRTAAQTFPPEKACAFSLQLLAGVAAVEAMNRPIDSFVRLRTGDGTSFPAPGYTIREAANAGGVVTSLEIVDAAGDLVDPRRLGVKPRDFVQWLGGTATVASVGPTVAVLADSTITVGSKAVVSIESAPGRAYKSMRTKVNDCLAVMPTTRILREQLRLLDGTGVSDTRKLVQFLADTANFLHPLGIEPLKTLERMGLEVSTTPTLSDTLLEFAPIFPSATKQSGNDLLDLLESDGFSLGREYLMQGNLEDFILTNAQTASLGGRFDYTARMFSSALTTRGTPGVSGR